MADSTETIIHTIAIKGPMKSLTNLQAILKKADTFAKKQKISEQKLLHSRLRKDMYDLTKQVQYAYFLALDIATNLSGKPQPKFSYDEKTLKELDLSIARTIRFLKTISPKDISGFTTKKATVFFEPKRKISAEKYLAHVGIPDFYFHIVIAYGILRHIGVEHLGKSDFIGTI